MKRLMIVFGVTFSLFVAVIPAITMAQDIELYLGAPGSSGGTNQNLLFILDASLSMGDEVLGSGDMLPDGTRNRDKFRIEILKEVMDSTIAGLNNMNVGYMRMNGTASPEPAVDPNPATAALDCPQDNLFKDAERKVTIDPDKPGVRELSEKNVCYIPTGGNVLFPVSDLETPIADLAESKNFTPRNPFINKSISKSAGDAQQLVAGAISLDSRTLDIGHAQCSGTTTESLTVTSRDDGADDLSEELQTDAMGLAVSVSDFNSRSQTINIGKSTSLAAGGAVGVHSAFRFDLGSLNIPANSTITEASLVFTTDEDSTAELVSEGFNVLIQALNPDVAPGPGPIGPGVISTQDLTRRTSKFVVWAVPTATSGSSITNAAMGSVVQDWLNNRNATKGATGDITEPITFVIGPALGGVTRSGRKIRTVNHSSGSGAARLNLTYCQQVATDVHVGLNFQDVNIPQGSKIDSASINFLPATSLRTDPELDTDSVTITAHKAGDSPEFSTDLDNLPTTTTSVNWTGAQMGTWSNNVRVSTVDLSNIVQEIVNQNDWCGGNGMSFIIEPDQGELSRRIHSFDSAISESVPVLNVEYVPYTGTSTTMGCDARRASVALARANHSSLQLAAGPGGGDAQANAAETILRIENESIMGMIFALPIGATGADENIEITKAELVFYTGSSTTDLTGFPNINIHVERNLNPSHFSTGAERLTNRPRLTDIPAVVTSDNNRIAVDVKSLVSAATERTGWQKGYNIAFLLETDGSPTNSYSVHNWNTGRDTNQQPRLNIEYKQRGASTATVRDALLTINKFFQRANLLQWTPSVETLFEAALYWRGKDMVFGLERGAANKLGKQDVIVSSQGNVHTIDEADFTFLMERTTTSHPGSWTGGMYNQPAGHPTSARSCQYRHDAECVQDSITGAAKYISPIVPDKPCTRNFQILLTDGQPTWVNESTEEKIKTEFGFGNDCSVDAAKNAQGANGRCAIEMLRDMNNNDQSTGVAGKQTVQTHTVAFNLEGDGSEAAVEWLKQLADAGDGDYYEATNATALQSAFNQIIGEVLQAPRSFNAPSIPVNAFNPLFSRDEIYYGLFEAEKTPRWDGNLKKYRICTSSTMINSDGNPCTLDDIIDRNNDAVFRDDNGNPISTFNSSARSVWSSVDDGAETRKGGAGAALTQASQRTIYTQFNKDFATSTGDLSSAGHEITIATWADDDLSHIRAVVCRDADLTDLQAGQDSCKDRMFWMLGAADGDTTQLRPWWFPDILHSSPTVVTYGMDVTTGQFIDKVLVGSNGGGIHMIDGESGKEDWVFIPYDLFANQDTLYSNVVEKKVYGMDLTPVISRIDVNRDGTIDPADNDKVFGYFGMRRGGHSYYALDLTPDNAKLTSTRKEITPEFLWSITAGSGTGTTQAEINATNFSRLGQTWSEPVVARIRCIAGTDGCSAAGSRTVLIFGGGYDAGLDENFGLAAARPNKGNAIYIVDAEDGEIMLWISHDEVSGANAIAASGADIEVPDMLYSIVAKPTVLDSDGDGFMDRIYVGDLAGQVWRVDLVPGGKNAVVGKLASISDTAPVANQRRFHYPPTVVQVVDTKYSTNSKYDYIVITSGDRASPLADTVKDGLYAFRDYQINPMSGNANGLAQDYPPSYILDGNDIAKKEEGKVIKEDNLIDVTARRGGLDVTDTDIDNTRVSEGWFVRFTENGEKGLSSPIVVRGELLLTTYVPPVSNASDECSAAEGSGRIHRLGILNTAATQDADGDRSSSLDAPGIPSSPSVVFNEYPPKRSNRHFSSEVIRVDDQIIGNVSDEPRVRSYWTEDAPTF